MIYDCNCEKQKRVLNVTEVNLIPASMIALSDYYKIVASYPFEAIFFLLKNALDHLQPKSPFWRLK